MLVWLRVELCIRLTSAGRSSKEIKARPPTNAPSPMRRIMRGGHSELLLLDALHLSNTHPAARLVTILATARTPITSPTDPPMPSPFRSSGNAPPQKAFSAPMKNSNGMSKNKDGFLKMRPRCRMSSRNEAAHAVGGSVGVSFGDGSSGDDNFEC